MTWLNRLQAWTPGALAFLLLVLPPVKYQVHWVDGPPQGMSGWPLPWMADSMISSASFEIYLIPLAIDLALLLVIAWLAMEGVKRLSTPLRRVIVIATWFVAGPLLAWAIFIGAVFSLLMPDVTSYRPWYLEYGVERIEGPFSGRPNG